MFIRFYDGSEPFLTCPDVGNGEGRDGDLDAPLAIGKASHVLNKDRITFPHCSLSLHSATCPNTSGHATLNGASRDTSEIKISMTCLTSVQNFPSNTNDILTWPFACCSRMTVLLLLLILVLHVQEKHACYIRKMEKYKIDVTNFSPSVSWLPARRTPEPPSKRGRFPFSNLRVLRIEQLW